MPLIVHVLLSMDRPVGRAGETVHVAPVTLVMPPPEPLPEPLLSPVEESQVLLPESETGEPWSVLLPPSPNCPLLSNPQHFRSPLSRMAQVCNVPPATATAVRPCRGLWLWMKVRWCPCWFHHRPTVLCCPIPSTSGRRCQEWRRCGILQQTPQRPFGPCRG